MHVVEVPASGPQALELQVTILTMMTLILVRFSLCGLNCSPVTSDTATEAGTACDGPGPVRAFTHFILAGAP